jgi:integrase
MPAGHDTTADPSPSFVEAWGLWVSYRRHGTHPLRDSTLADYESIYRRHLEPAFGALRLDQLDGATIARFSIASTSAGVSAKRLSNVLVPLRACLRWHYRIGVIERDPSAWFDTPTPAADERRILTPQQIEALVQATPHYYRPFIEFAAYVGTRAGEQRALTWADVDLVTHTVSITKTYYRNTLQRSTKTGRGRQAPLPPHVAATLVEWRTVCPISASNLVFPSPSGRVLDLDVFRSRVFKPAVARAGLPESVRIHDLRHTAASLYLQSGATVREVMEIFGWSQMQTALRYLHTAEPLTAAACRLSSVRASALAGMPVIAPPPRAGNDLSKVSVRTWG